MAFLEPGIRDTCEWARLIPEERAGEPGEGAQSGTTDSSVRPTALNPRLLLSPPLLFPQALGPHVNSG